MSSVQTRRRSGGESAQVLGTVSLPSPARGAKESRKDQQPARPIRLLFVLTSPVRGGVEEVVLSLLTHLDRRHFEVGLACPKALLEAMAPELRAIGLPTFPASADSWFKPREVAKLASCIQRFRPDIVNPHLFRSTLVAAPLAKWLGVPSVVETYHGREAWRKGIVKGRFGVDRVVSQWVDRVIAVSESAREFLIHTKGISLEKVTVIPNGCDLSVFRPGRARKAVRMELGLDADAPVIGVVGRLEPQKGHQFLLDAFPRVAAEFPNARLLLIGDGSLRTQLARQAARVGIASHVIFAGFRTDIPRLLDAVDLMVLPSLWEGMPLTALEAAAMAKPIVATDVDGTAEVVQDGVTGRLVPPANASALGDAILETLRHPRKACQMGDRGREHILARFNLRRQVFWTGHVYRAALPYRGSK